MRAIDISWISKSFLKHYFITNKQLIVIAIYAPPEYKYPNYYLQI